MSSSPQHQQLKSTQSTTRPASKESATRQENATVVDQRKTLSERIWNALTASNNNNSTSVSRSPKRERQNVIDRNHSHNKSHNGITARSMPSTKSSMRNPQKPKSLSSLQDNANKQIQSELQREENILQNAQQEARVWQDAMSQLSLNSTQSAQQDNDDDDIDDDDDISAEYHRQLSSSSSSLSSAPLEQDEAKRRLQRKQQRQKRDQAAQRLVQDAIRQAEVELAQSSSSLSFPKGKHTTPNTTTKALEVSPFNDDVGVDDDDGVNEAEVQAVLAQAAQAIKSEKKMGFRQSGLGSESPRN